MFFHTVESWASRLGYVIEKAEDGSSKCVWHKEVNLKFNHCNSVEEAVDQIIEDIRKSLEINRGC
jgi:hypothetical protein